jgi:hypothetical protein
MTILDSIDLTSVTGGQQAAPQAPSAADEARAAAREEIEMHDKEELRSYERNHRFTSFLCQGDRQCLRDARGW